MLEYFTGREGGTMDNKYEFIIIGSGAGGQL